MSSPAHLQAESAAQEEVEVPAEQMAQEEEAVPEGSPLDPPLEIA
jgi:hypothetical protein